MFELEYPFDSEFILKKKKSLKKQLLDRKDVNYIEKKIAILGGSTTNDIKNILELFLLNYGIKPVFYESEYNQYYEEAMFPNQILEEFAPDIIYFHTSNRNVIKYPDLSSKENEVEELLKTTYLRFEQMWNRVIDVYHCTIIQNNFELPLYRLLGNKDASDFHGKVNFISRLNLMFYEFAQSHDNFFIHDINYESATYGLDKWSDPFYWHMYKYCMCVPAIPYTAFNLANIIKSIYGKNKKVISLDLDNTLWGGIIGDDGVNNIEIGQETSVGQTFSEFQHYIKEHKHLGVLLTINSKNNMEVACSGLRRPDTVLKEEDFVSIKANWEAKSQNLLDTAMELQLLPESFVFIDDNPAEREIVRRGVDGVAVPEIGEPEHYIQIIDKSGFFEATNVSLDDLRRNEMYKTNAERKKAELNYQNYDEYLQSLNMEGSIKEFEAMYMARISQLTNKSNQFNLTTRRYSQSEIEEVTGDSRYITLYGKLEDKFGDNGVVSVIIGNKKKDELHIDLWIMSCRVLKREMEYAMMDELVDKCKGENITKIYGYYYPTAKNGMVREFYQLQGFTKIEEDGEGNTKWEYIIDKNYRRKNRVIRVNGANKVK